MGRVMLIRLTPNSHMGGALSGGARAWEFGSFFVAFST
jgi:hypothetical protein